MSKAAYTEIVLAGEPFYLLPQKAMYRPLEQQLILSDVHLGKATHFRKMGIPMPEQSYLRDLDMLQFLLRTWQPHTVVILGDLFHSTYNREWLWLKALFQHSGQVQFILVEGNHDILPADAYDLPNLLRLEQLEEELFVFSHHPLENCPKLNICGHVHPGLRVHGRAKQSLTFPCFYFNHIHFILPAFGALTGLFLLEQEETSAYYLVTGERVIAL
jgi:DNA ligase-associated metallophosphoesterase